MERMADARTITTAEKLFAMPRDGYRYELHHGKLRQMTPPGWRHGSITAEFASFLIAHVKPKRLGKVVVETGFILVRKPDTVLAADVAFVRKERIPEAGGPVHYWPGAPDLAVEVVSPDDAYAKVSRKAGKWLKYGTRMVVVVEPDRRRLVVHRPGQDVQVVGASEVFDGADVVPGFRLRVGDLFDE